MFYKQNSCVLCSPDTFISCAIIIVPNLPKPLNPKPQNPKPRGLWPLADTKISWATHHIFSRLGQAYSRLGHPPLPGLAPLSRDTVYPPNQPVIVDPGNPFAPLIFPCGICRKEVQEHQQVGTSS